MSEDIDFDESDIPNDAFEKSESDSLVCPISGADIGEGIYDYCFAGVDAKLGTTVKFPKKLFNREFSKEDWHSWVEAWNNDEVTPEFKNFPKKDGSGKYSTRLDLVDCEKYGKKFEFAAKIGKESSILFNDKPVMIFEKYFTFEGYENVRFWKEVVKRTMSIEDYINFLNEPDSKTILKGFYSKKHKSNFDALLVWKEKDGQKEVGIGFPERK